MLEINTLSVTYDSVIHRCIIFFIVLLNVVIETTTVLYGSRLLMFILMTCYLYMQVILSLIA